MMKKKLLKIVGIVVFVFVVLLVFFLLFFKGIMEKIVKWSIDNSLNVDVIWEDFDVIFFSSFLDVVFIIKNFKVINRVFFEGDIFVIGEFLKFDMGVI